MDADSVAIAILAKAPVPGRVKTRLIPELGAHGAAFLHEEMIERTVMTACEARLGAVTLWTTSPHALFSELARRHAVTLKSQPDGDLGLRMLTPLKARSPALVVGTDCPALTPLHLREAAAALTDGMDAAFIPAEDGGYVLAGMRRPVASVFAGIDWGVHTVMEETRRRLAQAGLAWRELEPLWDVDTPADLARFTACGSA